MARLTLPTLYPALAAAILCIPLAAPTATASTTQATSTISPTDSDTGSEPAKREEEHQITRTHPLADEQPEKEQSKLIPLPVYGTLPSEGATFGIMPVVLVVDSETQTTQSIWAPSYTWNRVIGNTGTFRWFHYPNDHESLTITGGASENVNYGGLLVWNNEPKQGGEWTHNVFFRWGRSIFYQFFGLGPNTTVGDISSHTRIKFDPWYRLGRNIGEHFNLGARLEFERDVVEDITQPGLPSSTSLYAGTPGMGGSTVLSESLDIRYDSRPDGDYSSAGSYADFSVGPTQGLSQSPDYWTTSFEAKTLYQELDGLQGGARVFASYVTSPQTPFYHQSSLGGSFLMRGFTEDRFFDQGAWTAEIEQRIRLFTLHIYGVTSDWRLDPFIGCGQVFDGGSGLFSNTKIAGGAGFRAWVHPNVVGRVDVATAGEGLNTYVELGYPF